MIKYYKFFFGLTFGILTFVFLSLGLFAILNAITIALWQRFGIQEQLPQWSFILLGCLQVIFVILLLCVTVIFIMRGVKYAQRLQAVFSVQKIQKIIFIWFFTAVIVSGIYIIFWIKPVFFEGDPTAMTTSQEISLASADMVILDLQTKNKEAEIIVKVFGYYKQEGEILIEFISANDNRQGKFLGITRQVPLTFDGQSFHFYLTFEELAKAFYDTFKDTLKSPQRVKGFEERIEVKLNFKLLPPESTSTDTEQQYVKKEAKLSLWANLFLSCPEGNCQLKRIKKINI